jgi:hypothetical protein
MGYIVIDKYYIVSVSVSGSGGGIGSNTTTKNSDVVASNKVGSVIVVKNNNDNNEDNNNNVVKKGNNNGDQIIDDNKNDNKDSNNNVVVVKDNNDEQSTSPVSPSKTSTNVISIITQKQIENYRNGTALMLNVNMTHHGGTYRTPHYCLIYLIVESSSDLKILLWHDTIRTGRKKTHFLSINLFIFSFFLTHNHSLTHSHLSRNATQRNAIRPTGTTL